MRGKKAEKDYLTTCFYHSLVVKRVVFHLVVRD